MVGVGWHHAGSYRKGSVVEPGVRVGLGIVLHSVGSLTRAEGGQDIGHFDRVVVVLCCHGNHSSQSVVVLSLGEGQSIRVVGISPLPALAAAVLLVTDSLDSNPPGGGPKLSSDRRKRWEGWSTRIMIIWS